MARIQIFELPMVHVGEYMTTPFSIIIDQIESGETATADLTQAQADAIALSMGAVSAVLVRCTLDLA